MDQAKRQAGIVYLIGGGPGDPELLTLKAARLLAAADVVAYDDLINPAILSLCSSRAELIPVGYRGLRSAPKVLCSKGDPVLPPMLLARARRGEVVVRLKCGDPLVFGRGGEEALELQQAGIAFEIVPGITAALGAAAYAGIPLTHRGVATSVTLATGHLATGVSMPPTPLPASAAQPGTLVLYMPRHELGRYLGELIKRGLPAATPAAFVSAATTPAQQVIEATAGDLAAAVERFPKGAPGLVIIGHGVALRASLSWFRQAGPLAGRRLLVARARSGASKIAAALRGLGAEVLESPLVQERPLPQPAALDAALAELFGPTAAAALAARERPDCLAFACAASVHAFMERLRHHGYDSRAGACYPLLAVGEGAAHGLRQYGWQPWRVLRGSCEQALNPVLAELHAMGSMRLFLAAAGRPRLVASFARVGVPLRQVPCYETRQVFVKMVAPLPELLVLPSSSAARSLLESEMGAAWRAIPMVAIGPVTAAAAAACGAEHVVTAAHDEPSDVVRLALALLTQGGMQREAKEHATRQSGLIAKPTGSAELHP